MRLTLDGVSKRVGAETHLYEMSLTLEPGLNVLLGQTLAGKTSLMRLMAGLDRPSGGRVLIDERDVTGVNVRKRSVAFVYQQFINYPSLTVFENIASPLRVRGGLRNDAIKTRVHEVAEMMHIEGLLDRLPAELSGGQQQRTAIARALVKDADLLLLDEPLVNLDYKLREELRLEMRNIFTERGAVVVYATTEPDEALLLGGRTAVLAAGRLLQTGPTLNVYHHPESRQVGEVFSDPPMNIVEAEVRAGELRLSETVSSVLPSHMQALPPGSYQVGVRANHAEVGAGHASGLAVPATVQLAEISGSETFLHVDHEEPGGRGFRLVAQLEGVRSYALGEPVTLYLDPARLFAFGPDGRLAASPSRTPAVAV